MFHRRIRSRGKPSNELNITSFMNVLVVLVSFLLATAVFSQIAKLEMNGSELEKFDLFGDYFF